MLYSIYCERNPMCITLSLTHFCTADYKMFPLLLTMKNVWQCKNENKIFDRLFKFRVRIQLIKY